MIYLAQQKYNKIKIINDYCQNNNIEKIIIFSPNKFKFDINIEIPIEQVEYNEIIQYSFFYRLLREITPQTLLVVNECLRTQNRNDLTYNCLRHYLNQSKNVLVFQAFPLIENIENFMILFDFATQSKWKLHKFDKQLISNETSVFKNDSFIFEIDYIKVLASDKTKQKYNSERTKLFNEVETSQKDPHIIPRTLYQLSWKDKLSIIGFDDYCIARNNRFNIKNLETYKSDHYIHNNYTILDFPHNRIDFTDFLTLSQCLKLKYISTDLKVENFYINLYNQLKSELENAYTSL